MMRYQKKSRLMLFRHVSIYVISLLLSLSSWAYPSIQDENGTFTLPSEPKRIVVLELSFVDALVAVGLSPIGIADDNDPNNLLPEVKAKLKPWTSLGMRSQPSMERIAELQPDLIIADFQRHAAAYDNLSRIAPTLLLKSRGESYLDSLASAEKIGIIVNKNAEMQARLSEHKVIMASYRKVFEKMTSVGSVQFAIVSARGMWLHGPDSYAGGVLNALGLASPIPDDGNMPYLANSLELLLKVNPNWLLIGSYGNHTVLDDWRTNPLFQLLTAEKKNQLIKVSPELWSLNRGILAAEGIAKDLNRVLSP